MKGCWGSGGIAPRILNLGTRWRWVVSFTPKPLYPQGKRPCYPLDRRLGVPVWARWWREKFLSSSGPRIPDHPACSPALYRWGIPAHGSIIFTIFSRKYSSIQLVPGALTLGLKRPGFEADHSPPSSAEVIMCGAIPPLFQCFLHVMVQLYAT
jgi:hypothetical protein